ncbi:hypothetical protein [Thalassospira sp. GB04J01]|uniref:hypothetical protein n=1 Tax=Thalassospira sp. GB04J01 TaxID=1485225 RepID=UPI000C9BE380|nr:hypothetical protein [Thalassospira sp. GB04J01]|tara:strand:- start:67616 stop:67996 length:381 start_codon:yes stop_codon:yes gene_type:complete
MAQNPYPVGSDRQVNLFCLTLYPFGTCLPGVAIAGKKMQEIIPLPTKPQCDQHLKKVRDPLAIGPLPAGSFSKVGTLSTALRQSLDLKQVFLTLWLIKKYAHFLNNLRFCAYFNPAPRHGLLIFNA